MYKWSNFRKNKEHLLPIYLRKIMLIPEIWTFNKYMGLKLTRCYKLELNFCLIVKYWP